MNEIIGQQVEIVSASNLHQVGTKGKVIDETKATITMQLNGVQKKYLKNSLTIKFNGGKILPLKNSRSRIR